MGSNKKINKLEIVYHSFYNFKYEMILRIFTTTPLNFFEMAGQCLK